MKLNIILTILTLVFTLLIFMINLAHAGPLMKNWGLYNLEKSSHIDAIKAWKLAKGGKQVKVCVVDTGVDVTHPELEKRICRNSKTEEYGWDFAEHHKNPTDANGHGTHVTGIVRAVSPTACIIPVRSFSDDLKGEECDRAQVDALKYCISHGAKVVNYSGGGHMFIADELQVIREASNVLFVVAAGNEHSDLDHSRPLPNYPASYGLPNVIAVAAGNIQNEFSTFSNWGPKYVDVVAPGEQIYSTLPGGGYGYYTGTSQAAPFVSGVAAMVLSKYPYMTPIQVKKIILQSVDLRSGFKNKIKSGGKVNAYKAMLRAREMALKLNYSKVK